MKVLQKMHPSPGEHRKAFKAKWATKRDGKKKSRRETRQEKSKDPKKRNETNETRRNETKATKREATHGHAKKRKESRTNPESARERQKAPESADSQRAPQTSKAITPCGTRTHNLRIRSPTPCPLGQGGLKPCASLLNYHKSNRAIKRKSNSATGTRTRVARVRAEYPNQLDYSGF